MPQGRIILKSICQSKKLASIKSDGARLLYTWLIPNLDVNGYFSADPKVIKGQIFTRLKKTNKVISKYLEELQSVGLIIIYEAKGDVYLCVPDFVEKQPNLNPQREGKSNIPPPTPDQLQSKSGVTPTQVKESKVKQKESKYAEGFENFWKVFKGRWNTDRSRYDKGSKLEAWEVWQKMIDADKELALKGASRTGDKKTKDCCRWLKYRCWET